jgi:hypothetical protein
MTRNTLDTNTGPSEWFTGTVYSTQSPPPRRPRASEPLSCASPRAPVPPGTPTPTAKRSTSPRASACASARASVEEVRPGERVYFEPSENHWDGAAPNRFPRKWPCRKPMTAAAASYGDAA